MNHLWQSSAFTILAAVLAFLLRRSPAKVRYWIWLSASLKFLVPLTLLVSLGTLLPHPAPRVSTATPVIRMIAEPFTAPVVYSPAPAQNEVNWIGILWAVGFFAVVLARCRAWLRIRTALRSATPVELPIPIPAVLAEHTTEPGIVGFTSPVLVLPPKLLDHLNAQQLSAILAHEMCHVRRRDNLFAAIHMLVEAIFWFNPLVWWIGSRLVEERERACDEEVLRTGCEPADYVDGILKVCRLYRESPLPCISGVTGADVKKRLRAILSGSIARDWTAGKKIALATAGLVAIVTPIAIGILNAAPPPKFEVASIRPCQPGQGPLGFRVTHGNLRVVCMSVKALIGTAYTFYTQPGAGVFARDAISGGPPWASSDAWDIEAKAEGNPNGAVMGGPMLRQLLEDRFKLKLHRDVKKIPVYELAVAKSGLKLKPLDAGSCTPVDTLTPGPAPPGQRCNWQRYNPRGIDIHAANLDQLADRLSRIRTIDRPVINRTRIDGIFDVRLEFSVHGPRMTFTGNTDAPPVTSEGPSIFTALDEQLGLKLVPAQGTGAFLVIDRVERPTEN